MFYSIAFIIYHSQINYKKIDFKMSKISIQKTYWKLKLKTLHCSFCPSPVSLFIIITFGQRKKNLSIWILILSIFLLMLSSKERQFNLFLRTKHWINVPHKTMRYQLMFAHWWMVLCPFSTLIYCFWFSMYTAFSMYFIYTNKLEFMFYNFQQFFFWKIRRNCFSGL